MQPAKGISRHSFLTIDEATEILDNLRPEDAFELSCSGADRAQQLAVVESSSLDYVWYLGDTPVFTFGIIKVGHVGHLWGFGTRDTRRVIPAATRWGLKHWLPDAFEKHGIRRIEVRVPRKSRASIDWLTGLGMRMECGAIHDSAANGEIMVQLAYTTNEYRRDYVLAGPATSARSGSGAREERLAEPA